MLRNALRKLRSRLAPFPIEKPIFVIAPPRSGSSFFFECLSRLEGTTSLSGEAYSIWQNFFPYERLSEPSDRVYPGGLDGETRRSFRERTYLDATATQAEQDEFAFGRPIGHLLGTRSIRYLDKTIANCFRIDVIRSIFPEAQFIFLVRDPRANISSMIEGWSYFERFGKPKLTPVIQSADGTTVKHWNYPAPPDWQEVLHQPLPKICAWSWKQHVEWALDFFGKSPPVKRVYYENLRDNPTKVMKNISGAIDATITDELRIYLDEMPESWTTVFSPEKGKWRRKNEEEVESIIVRSTASRIGYDI